MGRKIRLSEASLRSFVKECVKRALTENMYDKQWEEEIRMFFNGLQNGSAFMDDDTVYAEYETEDGDYDERDPRYIYYRLGDRRLNDDHFCVQHSRALTDDELRELYRLLGRDYGVEMPYELLDDEYGY